VAGDIYGRVYVWRFPANITEAATKNKTAFEALAFQRL